MKQLPTQEYLQECFNYDPLTGVLTWKTRPVSHFKTVRAASVINSRCAGKPAGCLNGHGRKIVSIGAGVQVIAARLIWKLVTGDEPEDLIDHKDLDKANDRWDNLRPATKAQNEYNTPVRRNNTAGFKNVCWAPREQKYRAYITAARKQFHLGYFDTPEEANNAVKHATPKYHGVFGRTV